MRRIVSLPVLAAFVVLGASCSQQVQQPVKKAAPPPVYVGKVEQVYPNHHYVLIALAGNVYEPGTVLISGPGRKMQSRQPDCDGGADGACAHSCGYPQRRCGGGGPGVPVSEPGCSGKFRKDGRAEAGQS